MSTKNKETKATSTTHAPTLYQTYQTTVIVSDNLWIYFMRECFEYGSLTHTSKDINNACVAVTLTCPYPDILKALQGYPGITQTSKINAIDTPISRSTLRPVIGVDNAYRDVEGNVWEYTPNGQMQIATSESALKGRFVRKFKRLPEDGEVWAILASIPPLR